MAAANLPTCFCEQIRRYTYLIRLNRLRQDHAHHLEQAAKERSVPYPGLLGILGKMQENQEKLPSGSQIISMFQTRWLA